MKTMPSNEDKIKEFARKAGIGLVGIAGEGRFDGPPSLDPTYTLKGARAIVSMALPMSVPAIYDFLSKKSHGPHNLEQLKSCQRMHRICRELASYIGSLGYKAIAVAPNNTYRRSLDPFSTRPSFSHRFGAVVAGLGTFGLSGNVVTKQYGAAIYLGTVITDAPLKSDPVMPARNTMDNRCRTCKLCDKSCTLRMFRDDEDEYLLINGELHVRGKRDNLDLCNMPCFGLHGISSDKKWTNWGRHWIREYTNRRPDPADRTSIRRMMMREGPRSGDGGQRYDVIRRGNSILWPRDNVEDLIPDYEDLPGSEEEIVKLLVTAHEHMGVVGLKDPYVLTCGQCSLVCGPDFEETKKRYDMLIAGGYVVPGPDGKMVHANTYDEALKLKSESHVTFSLKERLKNSGGSIWLKSYFGFEPKGEWQNRLYQRKVKKACADAGLAGQEARAPSLFLGIIGAKPLRQQKKSNNISVHCK
jgi:hypothetical protein